MGSAVAVAGRSQGARQLDVATEADEDVRALQVVAGTLGVLLQACY